jgi:hypothetical protein
MEKYLSKIKNSPLFANITEEELLRMFKCFGAIIKNYKSGALKIMSRNFEIPLTGCVVMAVLLLNFVLNAVLAAN